MSDNPRGALTTATRTPQTSIPSIAAGLVPAVSAAAVAPALAELERERVALLARYGLVESAIGALMALASDGSAAIAHSTKVAAAPAPDAPAPSPHVESVLPALGPGAGDQPAAALTREGAPGGTDLGHFNRDVARTNKILALIREKPRSTGEIGQLLELDRKVAHSALWRLKQGGILEHRGVRGGARWHLGPKAPQPEPTARVVWTGADGPLGRGYGTIDGRSATGSPLSRANTEAR